MSSRDEQRAQVVEALVPHILATGLSRASLRQLANAAGVSDRMLLYYFADKAEVLAAVMGRLAGDMAARLEAALPAGERLPAAELAARAARVATSAEFSPFMRLCLEIIAAAARGAEPFEAVARQITGGFIDWIVQRLDAEGDPDPAGTAAAILALVDGLALVEAGAGRERVEAAVAALERQAKRARS